MTTAEQQRFIDSLVPGCQEVVRKNPRFWVSVLLGQAILESGWGASNLSSKYNNLFGVKWSGDPSGPFPEYVKGAVKLPTKERIDLGGTLIEAYFRVYDSRRDSIFDQVATLLRVKAYAATGAFEETTPEGFIRKIGPVYTGGDRTYAENVIKLMDQHSLRKYDIKMGLEALNTIGNVTKDTALKAREILEAALNAGFDIKTVYGYNPASVPEHSSGKALDFMVYSNRAAGDFIADYAWRHRDRLRVRWIIWYQRIRSTSPGKSGNWEPMASRGDATQDHKDHPHIFFDDGYTPLAPVPVVDEKVWLGERLAYHGFDRHTDNTLNLREFQMARMGRYQDLGILDAASKSVLGGKRFVSSMTHATKYFTPADVRIMRFAQLKLGVAPLVASESAEMWNGGFAHQWSQAAYLLGFMGWQAKNKKALVFPMTLDYWTAFAKESGVFDPVE